MFVEAFLKSYITGFVDYVTGYFSLRLQRLTWMAEVSTGEIIFETVVT